jgi:hypothetical protein
MRLRHRIESYVACVIVPPTLELMPATRVLDWLARVPRRRGPAADPSALASMVDGVLYRLPWIWRRTCLRRAATLAVLLRRDGRSAEVVIGVRRSDEGALEAHAWLRCDGAEPYLERGETSSFVELKRMSDVAS